ncbi:MAG: hypothetical protein D6712_11235, partial [Chloroflexi bacterium]
LVLIAVEYGPTAAAELDSATYAVLQHVLLRSARPVIVSGNPVALLHGQNILQTVLADLELNLQENHDYYVIRFYAGETIGLRDFVNAPARLLSRDVRGNATNLQASGFDDFAAIVVLAERAEELRAWAEQVAPQTRAQLVAVTGYSAAPLAAPYVYDGGAYQGLLVGYQDAYTYNRMLVLWTDGQLPDVEPPQAPATATPIPPTATPFVPTPTPAVAVFAIVESTTTINMRSGAGTEFEVMQGLAPQTEGLVIGESEDGAWTQIRLEDDTEGWIATQLLRFETRLVEVEVTATPVVEPTPAPVTEQPIEATPTSETEAATPAEPTETPTPAPPTATPTPATVTIGIVNADTAVNVREEPNGAVLAVARPGDELLVIGQNEDESWTQVRLPDGREGWIATFLL